MCEELGSYCKDIISIKTNTSEDFKWRRGVLGAFVLDDTGNYFGLTCDHVTRAAADGIIYIENNAGNFIQYGRTLPEQKKAADRVPHDIDIFTISQSQTGVLNPQLPYKETTLQSDYLGIYKGDYNYIFGMNVFRVSTCGQPLTISAKGQIATKEAHKAYGIPDFNFLVHGEGKAFAEAGDSGSLVVLEDGSGSFSLIGMVVAGRMSLKEGCPQEDYTVCLLLRCGLQALCEKYDSRFHLQLDNTPNQGVQLFVIGDQKLPMGQVVWVKSPCNIQIKDFDLFIHLNMLLDCLGCKKDRPTDGFKTENEFEELLSKHVNQREDVMSRNCISDTPDQVCFFNCMVACQCLYEGNHNEAEKYLKRAIQGIMKTHCPARLLCKLITYTTWLFFDKGSLDKMGELLKCGEEYMLEMNKCHLCPLKSIGYHYFDYARFFLRLNQRGQAIEMAKKSIEWFKQDSSLRQRPSHGQIHGLAMLARLKLNCGETFEHTDLYVPKEDIREAFHCLQQIQQEDLPAVQRATYLLANVDLYYRQGNTEMALQTAELCFTEAKMANLQEESVRAELRVNCLKKLATCS